VGEGHTESSCDRLVPLENKYVRHVLADRDDHPVWPVGGLVWAQSRSLLPKAKHMLTHPV
jgi:hypothetical protein